MTNAKSKKKEKPEQTGGSKPESNASMGDEPPLEESGDSPPPTNHTSMNFQILTQPGQRLMSEEGVGPGLHLSAILSVGLTLMGFGLWVFRASRSS
jgi:hypothetical protein